MLWIYVMLTWTAALFLVNEIGVGRMTWWVGMYVFCVLLLNTTRAIYRYEHRQK